MKVTLIFLVVFLIFFKNEVIFCQTNEVSLTFDDLPVVGYGNTSIEHHQEIFQKLIVAFSKYNIPAIGFVNEIKLYNGNAPDSMAANLSKPGCIMAMSLGTIHFHIRTIIKAHLKSFRTMF